MKSEQEIFSCSGRITNIQKKMFYNNYCRPLGSKPVFLYVYETAQRTVEKPRNRFRLAARWSFPLPAYRKERARQHGPWKKRKLLTVVYVKTVNLVFLSLVRKPDAHNALSRRRLSGNFKGLSMCACV